MGMPIIALGASAGGLEALTLFFQAMPEDSHAAFVVVAHLDPSHISLMPELLQKHTRMPVKQIADGTKLLPDHVYIIPPDKSLCIMGGTLQLLEMPQKHGLNLPIDSFFRSLALDQGANAIGIILSGTGSDGTLGLKAIKTELGMTMVQDEASAKYNGMPHSAIASGAVDFSLPPDQMPKQLLGYLNHSIRLNTLESAGDAEISSNAMQKIFAILRQRTHQDFSLYKKNTICRRIERRMSLHRLHRIEDYVRYLQESELETDILFNEVLIGVTNFFRDPAAFESLQAGLLNLLRNKPKNQTVRVWVSGCSSGEEAYSIAMLLIECMESLNREGPVQIFATDLDAHAITTARAGLYPSSIAADVTEERLKRFFRRQEDGQYRIKKMVREMLIFAPQNLIKDPPFTKLDLLCCRNLLIYLGPELQKRLFPLFHYSLNPEGLLFLGSSESIGQYSALFKPVDKKWKIFRASPSLLRRTPPLMMPPQIKNHPDKEKDMPETIQQLEENSGFQMLEIILRESHAPPCVIINESFDMLYIYGKTGKFLEPAEGKISANLLEMARPGLKLELVEAVRKVALHKQEVTTKGVRIHNDGTPVMIDLSVKPLREPGGMRGRMMVVFEEISGQTDKASTAGKKAAKQPARNADDIEQELQHTRESLQTSIEELETSNEELKSTNEELQSTNEELQSTNEELETSKEELQSLNEESVTVNAELQGRIDEIASANDDMKNLFDSTDIATIFLDNHLCIRRFTSRITDILPMTPTDVGRPISHFSTTLLNTDLAHDAGLVLQDLVSRENEAVARSRNTYLVRLRPYRTVNNLIDGVVITFQDISTLKKVEKEAKRQTRFAEGIVNTIREPLLVLDASLKVVSANPAFYSTFGISESKSTGQFIYQLGKGQWDIPELRKLLEEVLPSNAAFEDFRLEQTFAHIGKCSMLINARRIIAEEEEEEEEEELILLAISIC